MPDETPFHFLQMLPDWLKRENARRQREGQDPVINTGSELADQVISVLLGTSMFLSGFIGFVLDNTIPGTDDERGVTQWRKQINQSDHYDQESEEGEKKGKKKSPYDLPYGMTFLRR